MKMRITFSACLRYVVPATICLITLRYTAVAQNYTFITYEKKADSGAYAIYLERVDLKTRAITDSVKLCDGGMFHNPKPLIFFRNGKKLMAVFVQYGYSARTHDPDKVVYFILDDSLNFIKKKEIPDAFLGGAWYSFEDSTIRIAMEAGIGKFTTQIAPEYIMDNDFEFRRATSIKLGGSTSPPIRRFLDIKETNEANPLEIAYGYVPPNNRWILRLNDLHNIVIDSLPINNDTLATVVYTYHPDIRKLYFFSFNYVNRGRIPEPGRAYGQSRIKPELQIYDPSTLKLLETRPIPDCPADNCPGRRSGGVAETVGDYIVYYFYYGQDSLVRYYPAMLFIFDTRTNEAIWLRVGWR